jgi:cyclitol oxidoreductase
MAGVVVVTGASSGIGQEISRALSRAGFPTIGVYNSGTQLTGEDPIRWVQGDLRKPDKLISTIDQIITSDSNHLVGLIYCAVTYGSNRRHPLEETTDTEWFDLLNINLTSQFIMTRHWLPALRKRPPSFLIALSSDVATKPGPGKIAYAATKAASFALFSGLAVETEGSGLSVIQMRPVRKVWTPGLRKRRSEGFDHSLFDGPDIFVEPVLKVARTLGVGLNGAMIDVI